MADAVLRESLAALLGGGHAHVTLEQAFGDVSPRARHRRPAWSRHSVWELLEHVRRAQEDILRYTLDASWTSPEFPAGYWPEPGRAPTDEQWRASLAGLRRDLREVIGLVRAPGVDLTAPIPHGEGRTYLRQVLLVADHNAYHVGQVVALRRALCDWPGAA